MCQGKKKKKHDSNYCFPPMDLFLFVCVCVSVLCARVCVSVCVCACVCVFTIHKAIIRIMLPYNYSDCNQVVLCSPMRSFLQSIT